MTHKGGVGKTTTVVSLAGALTRRGQRVLIVDLDPQGSCSAYFGFNPDDSEASVHDLFMAAAERRYCAVEKLPRRTAIEGLWLMPAATALVSLERRCGTRNGIGHALARELPNLNADFDFCLIDCPPSLGLLGVSALAVAELLLVPMQTEAMALRSIDGQLRTLQLLRGSMGDEPVSLIVPTLYDGRTRASRASLAALRARRDINLWRSYIPLDSQLREASERGMPLTTWRPRARAAVAYERLLDNLLEQRPPKFGSTRCGQNHGLPTQIHY
jgi:chromosome partitioning protein